MKESARADSDAAYTEFGATRPLVLSSSPRDVVVDDRAEMCHRTA
jgi:hypothetical protein